jgi:hypothetical protein
MLKEVFLFYINDMPEGITSKMRLFADDTIAYLTISSDQDARTLQSDLDKLTKWETSWLMAFHPEKCNVLAFENSIIKQSFFVYLRLCSV